MKLRISFFIYFLLSFTISIAKPLVPADSIFTRHKEYGSFFTFNTKQWTPRDTDITQIQCYQPFLNVSPDAIFLGNNGLAGRRMMPTAESNVGFRLENNVFNPYFFNENSVLYYDTKRPFTSITYVQGAKKEQFLNILHTQNITPLINVGFNYRRTKSDGFFAHQNTSYNNLRLFVSGRNKKNNLNYLINIYTNKLIAFENWGILSDTSFEQIGFGNKALLQVQNTSAQNNRNLSGGFAKSYFNFNRSTTDSTSYNQRFFIEANISRFARKYTDEQVNKSFYTKLYNDSTYTLDTSIFQKAVVWIGVETNPDKINNRFLWSIKWGNEWFENYNFYKKNIFVNKKKQTVYLGGVQDYNNLINLSGILNPSYSKRYSATYNVQYVIAGYNQGDRLLDIKNNYLLSQASASTLFLNINHSRKRPDFFQEHFFGNSVSFINDTLLKVDKTSFSAGYNNIKHQFTGGFTYSLFDNFIYFDTLLVSKQQTRTKNLSTFFIQKNISYKQFNWRLQAMYNSTSYQALRVPAYIAKTSIYLQTHIFKRTALSQVGLDATYFYKTKVVAYNPELAQFYLANGNPILNYPFIDFFWNVKISTVRLFFKVDHVNAGFMGNKYMIAQNQPYYDRAIRLGLIWVFTY